MTMVKLTSYWTVALKFISKLLFALPKKLPKECMIASGGSLSTLRRYVPVVVCSTVTLILLQLSNGPQILSITSSNPEKNIPAHLSLISLGRNLIIVLE